MTQDQEVAFQKLIEYSKNLENTSYDQIAEIIKRSIRQVPVATGILKKGACIDRVRVNDNDVLFSREEDISYIKDQVIIDNYLTSFGRANKPHQVMFYGALESTKIPQQRATAIFETSRVLKKKDSINLQGELVTVSRWRVLEDIVVIEIVFCDKAIVSNPDTQKAFEYHMKKLQFHPLRELGLRQIQFFSKEFAKQVDHDWDYKISVAYTNLILHDHEVTIEGRKISGIAYPSVPSNYFGQNIVLRPDVVDSSLELESVSTHLVHKNKLKSFVNNHKYVVDFGENNSNFVWVDMDPKHVMPLEVVIKDRLEYEG